MCFPSHLPAVKESFFKITALSAVAEAIDCTHIPIISLRKDDAEMYRNKKKLFSILLNVLAICTADRIYTNVVARGPGSAYESRIFENSTIRDKFESAEVCNLLLKNNGYSCKQYLITPLLHHANTSERAHLIAAT